MADEPKTGLEPQLGGKRPRGLMITRTSVFWGRRERLYAQNRTNGGDCRGISCLRTGDIVRLAALGDEGRKMTDPFIDVPIEALRAVAGMLMQGEFDTGKDDDGDPTTD